MEVEQGIHVPHLDIIFPLLHLRHAIHVIFGNSYLQPLTARKLLLVEEIMSGKFHIPSAKEAKTLSEGAASASQKKGKRKRTTLLDTRVIDDRLVVKMRALEVAIVSFATPAGTPPTSASVEPSPTKSAKKTRSKSPKSEGT